MKRFEYEIHQATSVLFGNMGKDGWELVSVDNGVCYFKRELTEASAPEKELHEKLDSPIDIHDLPTRVVFALDYTGVKTYRELINYGRINMLSFRNLGRKSLNKIDELFEEIGLEKYWYGNVKL
jgi:DNA-directed RNA polymerase alpha subunit